MVILGLGSNQGDRSNNLREALHYLRTIDAVKIKQVSPLYKSNALLPANAPQDWQQFYINIAVSCETNLAPLMLLKQLENIEVTMGRHKAKLRWAPRIIDIDILAWDNKIINTPELTIPHSELAKRPFALWPLLDLVLDWQNYIAEQNIIHDIDINLAQWGSRLDGKAPFNTHKIAHRIDIPQLMAIINVTPDSFSDGGINQFREQALQNIIQLFNAGADIIDLGAESTRPNATRIAPELEWQRLQPVLQDIEQYWRNHLWRPKISIDTINYNTAEKALAFTVHYINDVSGLIDPSMCSVVANADVHTIYMHNLGIPPAANMVIARNKNPVQEVLTWAIAKKEDLLRAGIKQDKLIFDPGIGFGKNAMQSLQILTQISKFHTLNISLLVGHSRKSFLNMCTDKPFAKRDGETAVVSEFLARSNVQYLRVHNIEQNMSNLRTQALFI